MGLPQWPTGGTPPAFWRNLRIPDDLNGARLRWAIALGALLAVLPRINELDVTAGLKSTQYTDPLCLEFVQVPRIGRRVSDE